MPDRIGPYETRPKPDQTRPDLEPDHSTSRLVQKDHEGAGAGAGRGSENERVLVTTKTGFSKALDADFGIRIRIRISLDLELELEFGLGLGLTWIWNSKFPNSRIRELRIAKMGQNWKNGEREIVRIQ